MKNYVLLEMKFGNHFTLAIIFSKRGIHYSSPSLSPTSQFLSIFKKFYFSRFITLSNFAFGIRYPCLYFTTIPYFPFPFLLFPWKPRVWKLCSSFSLPFPPSQPTSIIVEPSEFIWSSREMDIYVVFLLFLFRITLIFFPLLPFLRNCLIV